jgi:type IV pilus assembly protein PilC
MGVSDSVRDFWYIHLLVIVSIVFGIRAFIVSEDGRLLFDRLKFKLPVVKQYSTMLVTARFTRTLATLLYSGVPLLQALENVSRIVGNKVVEDSLLYVRDEVQRGQELAVPIKRSGIFPPMVDNMIRIGEESGTLDDILEKTADYFDEELDSAITRLTTMFEPILILVMGGVLGTLVVAMALPLFDVMKTVS